MRPRREIPPAVLDPADHNPQTRTHGEHRVGMLGYTGHRVIQPLDEGCP